MEQLIDQAAAGLKGDQELYLDVKQELRSHLEEKVEHFTREGHNPEESLAMARQSFGSPLDVAADLLRANRRRMRLRTLLRLGFGALIVPFAILFALYLGYGRFASLQPMMSIFTPPSSRQFRIPALPKLPGMDNNFRSGDPSIRQELAGSQAKAPQLHRYWQTHRTDKDSHMYYAYYAIFLHTEDVDAYTEAMRQGEKIEPENALYNVLLADYYLKRGMVPKGDYRSCEVATEDKVLDHRLFELGIAELHKAVNKPYLRTYQAEILRKKLNSLPDPLLTEDYVQRIAIHATELFPHLAGLRSLARNTAAGSRLLIAEGRLAKAEALMDTWRPYTELLLADTDLSMIHMLVANGSAEILTKQAVPIYEELGANRKAGDAAAAYERLRRFKQEHTAASRERQGVFQHQTNILAKHGSVFAAILAPWSAGKGPSKEDLAPGRWHEYVVSEEMFIQGVLVLLTLALVGTVLQGWIWLFNLRRAASVPILLLPPAGVILRAALLGIALPMALYWVYSRVPALSGRDFSLQSGMLSRFLVEMGIVGIVMLWAPTHLIRRYIRRRCVELGITVPSARDEITVGWKVRGVIIAALAAAVSVGFIPVSPEYDLVKFLAIPVSIVAAALAIRYAAVRRAEHGLYYGTMARSLAPLYAFSIIFIALTIQPWLMYNEVKLLRQDKVLFGYWHDKNSQPVMLTPMEDAVAREWSQKTSEALSGD